MNKRIITVLSIVVLLGAAILVFLFFRNDDSRNEKNRVANLSFFKNSVSERYAGKIDWRPAVLEDALCDEDAIKTLASSMAMVTFIDNAYIEIDENSVVIIRKGQNLTAQGGIPYFEILNGTATVYTERKIQVKTKDGIATVEAKDGKGVATIRVEENQTKISLQKGNGSLSSKDSKIDIVEGFGVTVKDGKSVQKKNLLPSSLILSPLNGQKVFYWGEKFPKIDFVFQKVPYRYGLQISTEPDFKNLIYSSYTLDNKISLDSLAPGKYYFRGLLLDDDNFKGIPTRIYDFSIKKDESLKDSKEKIRVEVPEESRPPREIPLKARVIEGDPKIQRNGNWITLGAGTNVQNGDTLLTKDRSSVEFALKGDSLLTLRENSEINLNSASEMGAVKEMNFNFRQGTVLLDMQKESGKIVTYVFTANGIPISLKGENLESSSSKLALIKRKDDSVEILCLRGRLAIGIGDIKTSIRSNQFFVVSPNGQVAEVSVLPKAERIIANDNATKVFYPQDPPLVSYIWKSEGGKHIFEVSKTIDFKNKEVSETVENNYFTDFTLPPGEYYWRHKTLSGKFSTPQKLASIRTRTGAFETIKVVIAEDAPDRDITFTQSPPVILLNWPSEKSVDTYEVELFKDENLKKRIYSKKVKEAYLSFYADFFDAGSYYWRIKRYAPGNKLIRTGQVKKFVLKLNSTSPTLRIDLPLNNSIAIGEDLITRGFQTKKGTLYINGKKIKENFKGLFESTLKIKMGKSNIFYKEISSDGTVSYYTRTVDRRR